MRPFAPVEEAISAVARGEIVIVVDEEDRENEGDLVMAAEAATPDKIAFFVRHTSGVICVAMPGERLDDLRLPLMVADNTELNRTAFTVSVDYRHGTSTGISSADRCATIRALINPSTRPTDIARPGHIFPLRGRVGGVLKRAGHTEAAIDLARLAGLFPAGVLCELVDDKGTGMARLPEVLRFAAEHRLVVISIADLIRCRRQREKLIARVAEARLPTPYGEFSCIAYESALDGAKHIALVHGDISSKSEVLVRVHHECLLGDAFRATACSCGRQLDGALQAIAQDGAGVVVYLRGAEGRAPARHQLVGLCDLGAHHAENVDSREYGIGAQILVDLGVRRMRLLTSSRHAYGGLEGFGLEITEQVEPESLDVGDAVEIPLDVPA